MRGSEIKCSLATITRLASKSTNPFPSSSDSVVSCNRPLILYSFKWNIRVVKAKVSWTMGDLSLSEYFEESDPLYSE